MSFILLVFIAFFVRCQRSIVFVIFLLHDISPSPVNSHQMVTKNKHAGRRLFSLQWQRQCFRVILPTAYCYARVLQESLWNALQRSSIIRQYGWHTQHLCNVCFVSHSV